MRKNGVNRELTAIEGGVCAPSGFLANAVYCGVGNEEGGEDFGLILAEKRCPTACVFSTSDITGAPVNVSKKHIKDGYAQAIVFNSGKANVFQENGEKVADEVCRLVSKNAKIDVADVLISSTGKINGSLTLKPFEEGSQLLLTGIGQTARHGELAAKALQTNDREIKQFSYAFDLSGIPCKIGVAFKGNTCVCPNMATVLGFITTDVKISSTMLQKALLAETRETFNLLSVDGISSPNDMICIMASGKAENCIIDAPDSEYKKFCMVLREVATRMCKAIVSDDGKAKYLRCVVSGAKSKQASACIAKTIINSEKLKSCLTRGEIDFEYLLYAIVGAGVKVSLSNAAIAVCSMVGEIVIMEEGTPLPINKDNLLAIMREEEVELRLDFRAGNYASMAFGRL